MVVTRLAVVVKLPIMDGTVARVSNPLGTAPLALWGQRNAIVGIHRCVHIDAVYSGLFLCNEIRATTHRYGWSLIKLSGYTIWVFWVNLNLL